jgi:hypothetical protein
MLRSSVTSRISWHSDIYWAVRRWHTLNKRELSKVSSSILNSVLLLIMVHYIYMNRQEPKLKGLSKSRFGSIIFLLRMAGIPFQMKNVSTIYAVYMITVIVCSFSTYIGIFFDLYIHWEELGRSMTTMRALLPAANIIWILSYCR